MRNGIYRVWIKGSVEAGAATLLIDGRFIACDSTHTYLGQYEVQSGHFTGDVELRRHTRLDPQDRRPDISMMHLEGLASDETAALRASFPDKPDFCLEAEYVWVCEA